MNNKTTPNKAISKFHSMAWGTAVRNASNKNDNEIETEFMPKCTKKTDGRTKTSNQFYKYRKGLTAPVQIAKIGGGLDLVDRIEIAYPNTKLWLNLPLWRLLSAKELNLPEIWQTMVDCKINNKRSFFIPNSDQNLVRLGSITQKKLLKLERSTKPLEAMTFLIGLIRESEIRLDVRSHHMAVNRIIALLPRISVIPEFEAFAGELFDYIEIKFFRVKYDIPDSGARVTYSESWREIYPELSKRVNGEIQSDNNPDNYRSLFKVAIRKSDSQYEFEL